MPRHTFRNTCSCKCARSALYHDVTSAAPVPCDCWPTQLEHTEAEHARKGGRWSVHFAQLTDLCPRLLCCAPRVANLTPERLGLGQPPHSRLVLQNRASLARGERVEDVVLLDLELLLVRRELAHPPVVPQAEVGSLLGDEQLQQLLLERGRRRHEDQERQARLQLGRDPRVAQLSLQEEPKVLVHLDGLITQLHVLDAALLKVALRDERHDYRVNAL
eukprot:4715925-Prymnesium_polylepis.2